MEHRGVYFKIKHRKGHTSVEYNFHKPYYLTFTTEFNPFLRYNEVLALAKAEINYILQAKCTF